MPDNVKEFRDGLFSLKTRRFGRAAELMIQKLFNLNNSDNVSYDLKTADGEKVEVKFSTVLKKCKSNITDKNLIKSAIASNIDNRMLPFEKAKESSFNCNIQQIKTRNFAYLYYGCFFEDIIMICKIKSSDIQSDSSVFYSNHQHSGNVGEGQFHISNRTLKYHLDKYFIKWLTYEELYDMFK